jgi:hypothetical protein
MHLCMEQDIECCAIQLESKFSNICALAKYREPTGDFEQFISKLGYVINHIFFNPELNLSSVVT